MIRAALLAASIATTASALDVSQDQRERMQSADVLILGEIHDNPDHHRIQAQLIAETRPKAVVFEMLTPAQAALVNASDLADLSSLGRAIGWDAAGWPDFSLYAPVFAQLDGKTAIGAAAPRQEVHAAFDKGAAAVFGPDASRFGLDQPLAKSEQDDRMALQFDAHCNAMPLEMMGGMVEAQRFRDAFFTKQTLNALARHGAPVVVITGNGHARRDWGMPAIISLAAPEVSVISVGLLEPDATVGPAQYDIQFTAPAPQRADPCAAFAK